MLKQIPALLLTTFYTNKQRRLWASTHRRLCLFALLGIQKVVFCKQYCATILFPALACAISYPKIKGAERPSAS